MASEQIPENFGGFVGFWEEDGAHVYLLRYGEGEVQEGVQMTPLNVLQAVKLLDELISGGYKAGYITDEDFRQSDALGHAKHSLDDLMPRESVDRITGETTGDNSGK